MAIQRSTVLQRHPEKFRNTLITFIVLFAFLSAGLLRAQVCLDDALYVTPDGGGLGTQASPANLVRALAMCQADTSLHLIKVSTGTHNIGQTLVIPSGVTIDGNYDYDVISGVWKKSKVKNSVLSVSPPGEELKTVTSDNKPVLVGHYIGILLDTVSKITLKDFTLEVHKQNNLYADMTSELDGKSVYGIFARGTNDVYMINLHIVTDSGGDGYYGYGGLDGASATYNVPGQTLPDQRYYGPRPSEELQESYKFRAGGIGGVGGRVQRYYRCLGCPSSVTSQSTYCAAEDPLPRGGTGGKNGGIGGLAGQNCEMDCYYEFYKSKVNAVGELLSLLSLPGGGEPKDPTPDPGANGRDGTGNYNGGDYTDQTIYPFDDLNYYYIPGNGVKGGDGSGGGGGGGGGAGGIRTLGLVPNIPGLGDYNLPGKALGLFNKAITLIGGDDVCNAEIVNGSTEGGPGGAGGEGGEGGGGGHGGGASIGVYAPMCKNFIDKNCVYTIGEGGKGGFGGYGGEGGQGGDGLPGRPVGDGGWSYQGAKGGKGGAGGDGSRGQHGRPGRTYTKVGVTTTPLPFIMSDISIGCTNSVISLYTSGGGFMYPKGGSSNDLNLVKDKPSGSSFTAFMPDVQIVATDTGRLQVFFRNFEGFSTTVQSAVKIKINRPLPALNVPTAICLGDTLKLSSDVASTAYSWKIYDANETLLYSSDKKSISFFPTNTGNYIVGFQVYDLCCGLSAPQYKDFRVTTVPKPIIKKEIHQLYCHGTDSTRVEVTTPVQGTDRLLWSNGKTESVIFIKDTGAFSVILTNADGCWKKSDSVENYVSPLPVGKPAIQNLSNICSGQEVTLMPDYDAGMLYNFYYQGTSSTSGFLVGGVKQYFLKANPVLTADSISYFVRKVSIDVSRGFAINCVSDDVARVTIYREKYPPVIVSDNVMRNIASDKTGCGTHYTYAYPKALDNCSPYVKVQVRKMPADHYYPIGKTVDTLRYTDVSGNILDYPIEITVYDVTPPVITSKPAASITMNNEPGTCGAYYPFTMALATDNCTPMPALSGIMPETITTPGGAYSDIFFISGSQADSVFSVGNNVIRQTWSDAGGNITTFEQTIVVKDAEAPKLQSSDITYYVGKFQNTVFTGYNAPLVTDNCSAFLTSSFVSGFGQTGEHAIGTTTEIWKATDASGNVGFASFKLMVLDTISPTIDCSNIRPAAFAIAGTDEALVTFAEPAATDNSGSVFVTTLSPGSGAIYKLGAHPLVYTATDNSGNSASCVINVVVSDFEAPTLTCPADIKAANDPGSCGAVVNFTMADAPDNDGSSYTPYRVLGLASGALFPIGTTQQVFKVADANGNTATCAFNVTVTDTQAPVFTACPGNKTEFITPELCGKMISLSVPAATDNGCMSPVTGFASGSAGGFFPLGVTHQVYRSTDAYGNSATCEFDVEVIDNTTLSITCPANVVMNSTPGLCGAVPSIPFPKANNLYGCLEWEKVSANGIGDLFVPGVHTVTYRAKALGQTAVCSFDVTINDMEPPKISQPENIVVTLDNGACGKTVTFTEPVVTDNCTNFHVQRTAGLASGAMFPVGTTEQKYIAFDNLNQVSTTFTISVVDDVAPVFTDVSSIHETTQDICGKVISFTAPVATDNSACFTITRLSGLSSGDLFPVGTTSQVYVARDASGNTDTTRFTIEVASTAQAQFNNCPADVVVMSDNDLTQVVWYDIPGRQSCSGVTSLLISGKGSGATFPTGTTTETYVITDASGKTDTCSFRVIVTEKVPPYIACVAPYFFDLDVALCGAWVTLPVPAVDDFGGSGLQTIYNDLGPNNTPVFVPIGFSQVEWTAVDKSGNRATCTNQIIVGRQEQPANPFSRVTVCEGSNLEIDPQMSGDGPYKYEWAYYDPSTVQTVVVSTDSIFSIPAVQESHQRQYSLTVFTSCDYAVYRREFLLTVEPSPVVTLTGLDAGYCEYDLSGKPLSYSPAGGVLVGAGIVDGKFYPSKAGIGTHIISYTYHDDALDCPSTASLTVTVYGTPVVAAFIDTAYCINHTILQLDAVNSIYSGPGISGATFNAAIAGAGTHPITRKVTVNGCVNSETQNVRIQGNVPDASILTAGPICSNKAPVKLESAKTGGTWTGETVSFRNDIAYFNVKAATLGEHKVFHKMVDDVCISIDSVAIEVVSSDYGLPYSFNAYCYDQGLVQMDVSDGKNYFGFGIENNRFNPAAYDTSTMALFGVSTLNARGCVDTVWRAMAVLKPELIDRSKLICKEGDLALLSADTKLESVTWFDNTTGYTKSVYDTGRYTVQLRNTFGCMKTDTFRVQTKQAVLPALINHTHQLFKCDEATAMLTANADYVNYLWSTGTTGQSITVGAPGEYKIYVTDDEDCELYDSIVVKNYPPITNNQITDNGTYLEAIASPSYAWYKNDLPIEGASGQILMLTESGDYYVSLLDENGCVSVSDVLKVVVTSIEDKGKETACLIYPNPGKGRFIFQFTSQPAEDLDITFINALGQTVQQLRIDRQSGQLMYTVNLETQPAGVYWALITQKDGSTTIAKLVKVD